MGETTTTTTASDRRKTPFGAENQRPPLTIQCDHVEWRDTITIHADGRYERDYGDVGSWSAAGDTLALKWDQWALALRTTDGGYTFSALRGSKFILVNANTAPSWWLNLFLAS